MVGSLSKSEKRRGAQTNPWDANIYESTNEKAPGRRAEAEEIGRNPGNLSVIEAR